MKHCHSLLALAATLLGGTCLRLSAAEPADEKLFPPELVEFVRYEHNPVFTARGEGHWDERIRERGWILLEDGTYHLWFTGYDGTREANKQLGYATSDDGLHWRRHPGNPIYEEHWVEDMMVLRQGDTYYMFAEGHGDRAHLLTSKDRIHWTRQGPLDVRKTDGTPIGEGPYGTPTVWVENGVWYLFYERGDRGVWLATSRDREVWTNVRDTPVLSPGPDLYDRDLIALNQIIKHGGRYYAYYHGTNTDRDPRLWATAVATSTDLIRWTKYPQNPLLPVEENKSSGILVRDGDHYRLYTLHDEVHVHFHSNDRQDR